MSSFHCIIRARSLARSLSFYYLLHLPRHCAHQSQSQTCFDDELASSIFDHPQSISLIRPLSFRNRSWAATRARTELRRRRLCRRTSCTTPCQTYDLQSPASLARRGCCKPRSHTRSSHHHSNPQATQPPSSLSFAPTLASFLFVQCRKACKGRQGWKRQHSHFPRRSLVHFISNSSSRQGRCRGSWTWQAQASSQQHVQATFHLDHRRNPFSCLGTLQLKGKEEGSQQQPRRFRSQGPVPFSSLCAGQAQESSFQGPIRSCNPPVQEVRCHSQS